MDQGGTSRAMRWCVVRVDASLVALDYAGGEIHGHTVVIDAAQRVVRSGKRTPIGWPLSSRLPDDAEWVHAAHVEDTQLAMPITLLVFRTQTGSSGSQRPPKRARRDPKASQSSQGTTTGTRLHFFAISSVSSDDWQLQSLGDATVDGDPLTQQIHAVDGPHVVAFNTTTSALSLLQPKITGEGEYAFAVTHANVALPTAAEAEVLSCQFMNEEVTVTPHLLLQYAETPQQPHEDDLTWRPPSERQHQWSTLPLSTHESTHAVMLPCTYLPFHSVPVSESFGVDGSEQITSCAFVPPPSPSTHNAQSVPSSSASVPQLRASVVSLLGVANSTLRVVSNGVLLASHVLAGVAHNIQIINAHNCSESAIVAAISCVDTDRSFHLLSIDVWGDRHRVVSPLQHFTFVGSMVELPFEDDNSLQSSQVVLFNDVASLANEDDYISLSLRKSVVISCSSQQSVHATSSCHRLKHRADEKTSKKRGVDRREENGAGGFQVIERVKIGKREQRDFEAQNHNSRNPSSASEKQLEMLTKSLQERLRVGAEQADRLKRVCNEKSKMVTKLNGLLAGSNENTTISNTQDDHSVVLVPVVTPDQAVEIQGTESSVTPILRRVWLRQVGILDRARIVSFDRSRSCLKLVVEVQATSMATEHGSYSSSGRNASSVSVFVVDYTNTTQAIRSWSRVRHVSRHLPLVERSQGRINLDVTIELPQSSRRPRQHLFRLGLWLRMEPATTNGATRDVFVYQTSARLVGEVEVDLTSLAEQVCEPTYGSTFQVVHDGDRRPTCEDEYLILSAGSSLPETILASREYSKLMNSQLQVVRPRFAVVARVPSSPHSREDQAVDMLLRNLPRDVVAMVNPLAISSLEVIQGLLHSLQSELDQLCAMENQYATAENSDQNPVSHRRSLLSTQYQTDLKALRVLNEWQRRIDFQSS